jgi:5-methyltetrahydrofolate--homocysteine methyltransferase
MVGLPGLLVKSAQQMVVTVGDLSQAGIHIPILVGGAALSENFVMKQIAPAYQGTVIYASDAMDGLDIAKKVADPHMFEELKTELSKRKEELVQEAPRIQVCEAPSFERSSKIAILDKIPEPPHWGSRILRDTPIDHVWRFVNPMMKKLNWIPVD